jgi:hypothetical protein
MIVLRLCILTLLYASTAGGVTCNLDPSLRPNATHIRHFPHCMYTCSDFTLVYSRCERANQHRKRQCGQSGQCDSFLCILNLNESDVSCSNC